MVEGLARLIRKMRERSSVPEPVPDLGGGVSGLVRQGDAPLAATHSVYRTIIVLSRLLTS
jgi:hypothetical protein